MAGVRGGHQQGRGAEAAGHALSHALSHVERQVSRLLEATLAPDNLTVDQWRVLDLLADGDGHPMSEIAGLLVVPGPTLTKIVDRLVDEAAVYRLVDDRDRRRVLAFLSEGGRALYERTEPRVRAAEDEVLRVLGDRSTLLLELLVALRGIRFTPPAGGNTPGAPPARVRATSPAAVE